MHVVAIVGLHTSVEAEAGALAADLGTTAYEERLKLAAGLPAIVLTSATPEPARALLTKIRARGQEALSVDSDDVVPSGAMVVVRRFTFEPDALVLRDGAGARLPYADILAVVRAVHRTRTETRSQVNDRSFSMGRALVTGGLVLTKTTSHEEKTVALDRDALLYLFRASNQTPWIVHERSADYSTLGAALAPSSAQNFLTLVARIRAAAPHAMYDERLAGPGATTARPIRASGAGSTAVSSASGTDLVAHILARQARK